MRGRGEAARGDTFAGREGRRGGTLLRGRWEGGGRSGDTFARKVTRPPKYPHILPSPLKLPLKYHPPPPLKLQSNRLDQFSSVQFSSAQFSSVQSVSQSVSQQITNYGLCPSEIEMLYHRKHLRRNPHPSFFPSPPSHPLHRPFDRLDRTERPLFVRLSGHVGTGIRALNIGVPQNSPFVGACFI